MKKKMTATLMVCGLLMTGLLSGCGRTDDPGEPPREILAGESLSETPSSAAEGAGESRSDTASAETQESVTRNGVPNMTIQFGYNGPVYTVEMEQNDTAAALADYAARGEYNLPIYTYENYENEDILQFYDIPSRYTIPAETEQYTEEKAGELFYSYPNRVVLFYQDAEIEADYIKIGTLTSTEGLVDAVTKNQPLEDWDCLVIPVRVAE